MKIFFALITLFLFCCQVFSQPGNPIRNRFRSQKLTTVSQDIGNIINDYTPVISYNICNNSLLVENASKYNVGDTVLLIQMKGAVIDSSNSAAFGNISNYKNAGNYEFNYVSQKAGNAVFLKNKLTRQYDLPFGKVQLIRVPYYTSANITTTLTCLPWDGAKGGVLVLNVRDTITMNANIDISGKGFNGALGVNTNQLNFNCFKTGFYYTTANGDSAAKKGEGISTVLNNKMFGRGKLANAGGGGNSHNSGGGGGGNGGGGGFGGYQLEACGNAPFDNRGIGGTFLTYNSTANKIFMGGGGGAGHVNNPQGFTGNGGNGGGLAIIRGRYISNTGKLIISNGFDGSACTLPGSGCHEGMGGGGAGGTIVLDVPNAIQNVSINVNGGRGGNATDGVNGKLGPGGGGGGGVIWFKTPSQPANITSLLTGGTGGKCTNYANDPWGSTDGNIGTRFFNVVVPIDSVLFKPNIDSVRINQSSTSCDGFNFQGLAFTNTTAVTSWQWTFGDGGTSTIQNPSHTYSLAGNYSVKLIVTDVNGCKDSIVKSLFVAGCTSISGVINDYTPVLAFDPCENKLTVENGTAYKIGDTVMLIQMKGTAIDSSNSAAFGDILNYKNAGNYEFNYVSQKSGNIIYLKNKLTRQYDIPVGKVQLIRVPYFSSVKIISTLTCLPWDGSKGGVLVLNVKDTAKLIANIDVSGKGFNGAIGINTNQSGFNCFKSDFFYNSNSGDSAARKGEGITNISNNKIFGRGKLANGGGGGNSHNSGGGGGSNGGSGGFGGYQLQACGNAPFDNRGVGGLQLQYNNASNKVFLGGGGGAGHVNNPQGFTGNGGNGGGMAIIRARYVENTGSSIIANGMDASPCTLTGNACHEGMGGGGSGGTVIMDVSNITNTTSISVNGGKGGNMIDGVNGKLGPGGGGGGGVIWYKTPSQPANITPVLSGGLGGKCTNYSNDPWGATNGGNGTSVFNVVVPIDSVLFKKNIDSVRISHSATSCNGFNFQGLGFTNTTPVTTWQWSFGDGGSAGIQNTSHTYSSSGTFSVKLVVTDINGCMDSIVKSVVVLNCQTTTQIVNDYTPVFALNPCNNSLTVEDGTRYNIGDTVLLIQMKGALVDTTNTSLFGSVIDYKNAGNYEFNYVQNKNGNVIELKNILTRQYTIPQGKVQLIRVPYFNSFNVATALSCLPWDGNKGGVLVFNVRDTLRLSNKIDVSGKGFNGGVMTNSNLNTFTCGLNNYFHPINTIFAAGKGESIVDLSDAKNAGRGSKAGGGGGGMDPNTGGGGGGNGSTGGRGGYGYQACPNYLTDNGWGLGGRPLLYNTASNKIFLAGGGGAGHCNNGFEDVSVNTDFNGGNGGGLVIITSNFLEGNNQSIISNGDTAYELVGPGFLAHDGMGGGGAGGTILINNNNYLSTVNLRAAGGKGGDMSSSPVGGLVGPGGGGSGGVIWFKQSSLPANVSVATPGGVNGVIIQYSNSPHGATVGSTGVNKFDLTLPIATVLFKKNIDSTRIKDTAISCNSFNFQGLGYTNTSPVTGWQWTFGDGGGANTQNTSHTYPTAGTYTVKLVVTDANGCRDSVIRTVSSSTLAVSAGPDTAYCQNGPVSHVLQGLSSGTNLSWSPAALLNNSTLQNPTATLSATTTFYLTASNALGCTGKDSVTISVNPAPPLSIQNNPSMCTGDTLILLATGLQSFQWSPAASVSNPTLLNPVFTGSSNQNIIVTGVNSFGCAASDTLAVVVKLPPVVNTIADTSFCSSQAITLFSSGAVSYSWSPAAQLSSPTAQNPVFTGNASQTYVVTGTASNGCTAKDTVSLTVRNTSAFNAPLDKSMCFGSSVQLDGNNGPDMQYVWSPSASLTGANTIDPIATPAASTTYNVSITDPVCNFDSVFRVTVTVNALPPISADKMNDIDCAHISSILSASGGLVYSWNPDATLSNTTIANPLATPTVQTQYIVTGTDANGCQNTDSVTVNIKTNNAAFYLANSFTPNGDGLNDCFGIKWGVMTDLLFMIYNRYGEKVFETKTASVCWNGFYKGRAAEPGGYVYYIKGKSGCGEVVRKGNLLLIR